MKFYARVRPDAFGWKPIAALAPHVAAEHNLARNLLDWIAGCAMVYFALFGVGELCLLDWKTGALLLLLSLLSAAFVYRGLSQVQGAPGTNPRHSWRKLRKPTEPSDLSNESEQA